MYRIVSLLLIGLVATAVSGQSFSVEVREFRQAEEDKDTALNRQVYEALKAAFAVRGAGSGEGALQLYSKARSLTTTTDDLVIVSLVLGYPMSKAALEAGARHEIFYADKPLPEDPEEGAFVRQYMTHEFLSDLVGVYEMDIEVLPRTHMDRGINEYVDALIHRHSCRAHGTCDNGK